MNKVLILVKSIFLNSFRGEGKKKKGQVSTLAGILISGGVFGILFAFLAAFMGPVFAEQGLKAEFLTMIFLASQIIILLFGTVVMVNIMFFSKDAEMLLYMPIKPSAIFAAKMIYVYLTELALAGFVVAVTGITFGIVVGFSVPYYLMLIPAVLIVPMLPLIIAALISVPIMYVISYFKNKSILATVMLVAIFGVFMYFYLNFFGNIGNHIEGDINLPTEQIKAAMSYMIPNISLARIVTLTSADYLTDIVIVLGFSAGLFIITLLLSSFTFRRGMASQLEEARSAFKGELKFEKNSLMKTLLLKDLKEIIRNPGLAFYALFPIVIAPIFVVFYGSMLSSTADEIITPVMNTGMSFFFTMLMVLGINFVSMSAISREGVNFNMSKTLPVPYSLQIRAKLFLSNIVSATGIIMTFFTMVFVLQADLIHCILFAGFALIMGGAFNSMLIYFDAKNPKLEWDSVVMALKNSKSSLISMFLSMGIGMVLFIGFILIPILIPQNLLILAYGIFWAIFYALAIIMYISFKKMLENNAERLILAHE